MLYSSSTCNKRNSNQSIQMKWSNLHTYKFHYTRMQLREKIEEKWELWKIVQAKVENHKCNQNRIRFLFEWMEMLSRMYYLDEVLRTSSASALHSASSFLFIAVFWVIYFFFKLAWYRHSSANRSLRIFRPTKPFAFRNVQVIWEHSN